MSAPEERSHVLVVDDEPAMRSVIGAILEAAGHATSRAASADEALALVRSRDPDLVLADLRMEGTDGMELLSILRRDFPEIPVVMLTAHGTIDLAVEAMRRGAADFLAKPFDRERVVETVARCLREASARRSEFLGPLATRAASSGDIAPVGSSPAFARLRHVVERVADSPVSVLVLGETGTGKELVAEWIHRLSSRRDGPLVRVNGAALPDSLVESELFGYERGAFSGADRSKPGRFELADGGTLFLDEVGELPASVQVKLLRVLQDGTIDPLGSTSSRKVDVRLIAATNRDLDEAVKAGTFRQDLLFRLNVVEVRVPPLRDRTEDIPALVELFLDKHSSRLQRPRPSISTAALSSLCEHDWPGNVRQLEHAVERAIVLSDHGVLEIDDFGISREASATPLSALRAATAGAERKAILQALDATGGNVTKAAELLGLSRRGLQMKMKDLNLRK